MVRKIYDNDGFMVRNNKLIEGLCLINCGSKSQLKVTQTANYKTVNQSDVNIVTNDVNKLIQDTFVKSAQACSATTSQKQSTTVGDIVATGGAKVDVGGIKMDQNTQLNFSCVQANALRTDIGNEVAARFMSDLQTNNSTDMLANLNATANQTAQSSSIPLLSSPATTKGEQNQTIDFVSTTKNSKNIEKNLRNVISNTITYNNVANCIAKLNQQQTLKVGNIVGTDAGTVLKLGGISLSQTLDSVTQCMQTQDLSSQIVNTMLDSMGVKTVDTSKTTMTGEATSDVTQEAISQSPLDALTGLFDGLLSGLGLGAFASTIGPVIVISSSACCCLILIFIIAMFFIYKK